MFVLAFLLEGGQPDCSCPRIVAKRPRSFLAEKGLSAHTLKKYDKEVPYSGSQIVFNPDTSVIFPNINSPWIFMKTEKKTDWLTSHLLYLKGLKSQSEAQKLFILLAEKSARSEKEEKIFSTLVKSEKAEEKANAARSEVSLMLESEKAAERKARTHKLVTLGLLFDYTELFDVDRHVLMGMVVDGALANENQRRVWAKSGKEFLAKKEPGKVSAAPTAAAPTATATVTTPILVVDPVKKSAPAAAAKPDIRTTAVALNVPYDHREAAKSLGARWDDPSKKWVAPAGVDVELFKKWLA